MLRKYVFLEIKDPRYPVTSAVLLRQYDTVRHNMAILIHYDTAFITNILCLPL